MNNLISLNTLLTKIDGKRATLSIEYQTYFGGCSCDCNSLDITVEDINITFTDKLRAHTNAVRIDIQSVLKFEEISDHEYKITTDDLVVLISL